MKVIKKFFCVLKSPIQLFSSPQALKIIKRQQLPRLQLKENSILVKNWWSESPFDSNKDLFVPIFSLQTGSYIGQAIQLQQQIFNKPLRRDLIYRLYDWRQNLNKYTTIRTKTSSTVRGSGRKIMKQKGNGRARLGQRRVPGRNKGPKAHGRKPKVYSYHLNQKIKLLGLKSLFSSLLATGKIRIIDSENLSQGKTKILYKYIQKNVPQRATVCFITEKNVNENFVRAQQNIERLIWADSESFDVKDLFRVDRVLITKKGLEELSENILKSTYAIHCQPHMQKIERDQQVEQEVVYNPQKPLNFKFKILQDYLQLYQKVKQQSPELLKKQMQKIRKIKV